MPNKLVELANIVMGRNRIPAYNPQAQATSQPMPSRNMLGTGMASNAASGLLMREYMQRKQLAEMNGEAFPATFEEWAATRNQ